MFNSELYKLLTSINSVKKKKEKERKKNTILLIEQKRQIFSTTINDNDGNKD